MKGIISYEIVRLMVGRDVDFSKYQRKADFHEEKLRVENLHSKHIQPISFTLNKGEIYLYDYTTNQKVVYLPMFNEVKERYDFYNEQITDLVEAKAKLEETIAEIDKEVKERAKKELGGEWGVPADEAARILEKRLGYENVKIVEKIYSSVVTPVKINVLKFFLSFIFKLI